MEGVLAFAIILCGFGIVVGTHVGLIWQGVLLVIGVLYLNSSYVGMKELAAIIDMVLVIAFIVGMVIGDISYAIQTDVLGDIKNPFVVQQTKE